MKILAIVGSPRLNGNTNYLVDQALQEASKLGAATEKVILSELKLSPCVGHENCALQNTCLQKDDGMELLDKFCQADGLILASPVYYYDVTAWMKIFIDRNYFLYRHGIKSKARAVGMIVVAGGAGIDDTVRTLKKLAMASTSNIVKERRFLVTGYASRPGDVQSNIVLVNEARQLGRQMAECLC